jgi:hypothetical protein
MLEYVIRMTMKGLKIVYEEPKMKLKAKNYTFRSVIGLSGMAFYHIYDKFEIYKAYQHVWRLNLKTKIRMGD